MVGSLSIGRLASRVLYYGWNRHGFGTNGNSAPLWPPAGNSVGNLGNQPNADSECAYDFWRTKLEVANPEWLSGGVQILPNLVLPWNRIAVIAFVIIVLLLTWLLLNKTRLGLQVSGQ